MPDELEPKGTEPAPLPLDDTPPPADDKPKRGRGSRASSTSSRSKGGRPSNADVRARNVANFYRRAAVYARLLSIIRPELAQLAHNLDGYADELGKAWAEWAATNQTVGKWCDRVTGAGGALGVLAVHVDMVASSIPAPELPADYDPDAPPPFGLMDMFKMARAAERMGQDAAAAPA